MIKEKKTRDAKNPRGSDLSAMTLNFGAEPCGPCPWKTECQDFKESGQCKHILRYQRSLRTYLRNHLELKEIDNLVIAILIRELSFQASVRLGLARYGSIMWDSRKDSVASQPILKTLHQSTLIVSKICDLLGFSPSTREKLKKRTREDINSLIKKVALSKSQKDNDQGN